MLEAFGKWLETTQISWAMTHYAWIWPACETLHFIGLAMLIGTVWIVDLRMLGVAKGLPMAPMHVLVRCGVAGFIINVVTGFLFFAGTPNQYIGNIGFTLKMVFIALAGINVLIFYLWIYRRIESLEPGEDAPLSAKIVAAASLFLWLGVMSFGRLLPYFGNAF